MKKVLALVLSVAMLLSLAACGTATEVTEETTAAETAAETAAAATQAETAAAATQAETAATEAAAEEAWKTEHPTWIVEEPVEISVTTFDGVTDTVLPPSNDVYFWQFVEKMTNVHVNWDVNPYSSYNEIVAAKLAAAQDLSDVIVLNKTDNLDSTLQSLGENGIIADMAPVWETNFKYLKNYWETNDGIEYEKLATNANGNMWAAHGNSNATNNRITALWNKAWLDKLGLEVPETLDDFYAVMKAFKEAGDLNGNGEDDELCLTSPDMSYIMGYFGSAFGLHYYDGMTISNFWDTNGTLEDERITDKLKNTLTFLNKLYEEGIFDPEVLTLEDDFTVATEKSTLGRYGCMILYSSFARSYGSLLDKYYVEGWTEAYEQTDSGIQIGVTLASEYNGNKHLSCKEQGLGMCAVVTTGEKQDIAMQWLDFVLASPEALRERCYGPEGIGYELDANGEPQLIKDADGNWINLSEYGCGQISLPHIQTFEQLMNGKSQWFIDQNASFQEKTDFYVLPLSQASANEEEQEVIDMYKTDVRTYADEMRNKFISGAADIETGWDEYVNTMKAMGCDELTAAYQSMYERVK